VYGVVPKDGVSVALCGRPQDQKKCQEQQHDLTTVMGFFVSVFLLFLLSRCILFLLGSLR
jgi:hypothetical protein